MKRNIRVVSLNGWYGRLFDNLMPYLVGLDADVYCLQEVLDARCHGFLYPDGEDQLAILPSLFWALQEWLKGHQGFFWPAVRMQLSDKADLGVHDVIAYEGIVTLVRKDIPVIGNISDFVHGEFGDEQPETSHARVAHVVRLAVSPSQSIVVGHMHGLRDAQAGKGDTPERLEQAVAFAQMLVRATRSGADDMVVACGDFNVLPNSQTLQILGQLGLIDLIVGSGCTDTRTSLYTGALRYADYMLVNSRVNVKAFDVPAMPEVSDHRPLVLDIEVDIE